MFAKHDKHYPSRSRQTSLATAVTKFTKPVTKNYFGPSTLDFPEALSWIEYKLTSWQRCATVVMISPLAPPCITRGSSNISSSFLSSNQIKSTVPESSHVLPFTGLIALSPLGNPSLLPMARRHLPRH